MSWIATLALAAGLSMVEVELREVEQTVVPPGSLSTAQARITPVGQVLRLPLGGQAQWSLSMGPPRQTARSEVMLQARDAQGRPLRPDARAWVELRDAPRPRWELSARLLALQGGEATLQLRWLREVDHGDDAWRAELRTRLDHWTTLSRQPLAPAPPPGTVSTRPVAEVRELQVRVRQVPE